MTTQTPIEVSQAIYRYRTAKGCGRTKELYAAEATLRSVVRILDEEMKLLRNYQTQLLAHAQELEFERLELEKKEKPKRTKKLPSANTIDISALGPDDIQALLKQLRALQ